MTRVPRVRTPRAGGSGSTGSGSRVVAARERFERRAARARRRPRIIAGIVAFVLLLGAFGYVVVWRSDYFDVQSVSVSGASGAEKDAALRAADIPKGRALMRVDTLGAAKRVARLPFVQSATVSRSFPHTISVDITPKKPVVVLKNPSGQLQVAGSDALPIRTVDKPPAGLPLLTVRPGGRVTKEIVAAVAEARENLPAEIVKGMQELSVGSTGGLSFTVDSVNGRRIVLWGSAGNRPDLKAKAVAALVQEKAASVIDVTTPAAPALR